VHGLGGDEDACVCFLHGCVDFSTPRLLRVDLTLNGALSDLADGALEAAGLFFEAGASGFVEAQREGYGSHRREIPRDHSCTLHPARSSYNKPAIG
jgi:hypothetical protein